MENLFPLTGLSALAPWLCPSSTAWAMDMILAFVCTVGVFLLLLSFLQCRPPWPPPPIKKTSRKMPVYRVRRSRKTDVAWKACAHCPKKPKVKEKHRSLLGQMSSRNQLSSSENGVKPPSAARDTSSLQPCQDRKKKSEELMDTQKVSYSKTPRENSQQRFKQLFWGLPSLHSESLGAAAWIPQSSSVLESPFWFNGIAHFCPVPMQANMSPVLSQVPPLSYLDSPSPPVILSLPIFQCPPGGRVQMQPHLRYFPQAKLTSSLPVIIEGETSCFQSQTQPKAFIPPESQLPERPSLCKQLKSGSVSPLMAQGPQGTCNVCAPKASQDWVVSSIIPENFPISPEVREQLDQHLQNWLIQHRWDLPRRIQESLDVMQHQVEVTNAGQGDSKPGPSGSSVLSNECPNVAPKGRFQLRKNTGKNLAQILGKVPKDISMGLERHSVKSQGASFGEAERNLVKCWKTHSRSGSLRNIDKKHESILKTHLGTKSWQIKQGLFPLTVRQSWLAMRDGVSMYNPDMDTSYLVPSKSSDAFMRTSQNLAFLDPCTRVALEAHVTKFRVKHLWGLPLKVIKSINILKWRKTHCFSLPVWALPSHVCEALSTVELVPLLGNPSDMYLTEVIMDETSSSSSLGSPVLGPSLSCHEMKSIVMGGPSADDHGLLNTHQSRHGNRCPSATVKYNHMCHSCQYRTVLETMKEKPEVPFQHTRPVFQDQRPPAQASVVSEAVLVWRSNKLTQQKHSVPKHQDSQKRPRIALAPLYHRDNSKRPSADVHEERAKEQKTSKVTQVKGQENPAQGTWHGPLPNTEQAPPKSPFQTMKHRFLHLALPKSSIPAQVEPLMKDQAPSAAIQGQREVNNMAEAQKLMARVGHRVEQKMKPQSILSALKTSQPKEDPPPLVSQHPLYQRPPSNSQQRITPSHLVTPLFQGYPNQQRHVGVQGSLKSVRFNNDQHCSQHRHLKLPNKAPLVSPSQHGTIVTGTSSHPQYCPRHCVIERTQCGI